MGHLAGKGSAGSNAAVNANDFNRNMSTSIDYSGSSGADVYGGDPDWHMYDSPWQHTPWLPPSGPVPLLP